MRRFFKKAARALRARRELAVAAATAIVAALIAGGQATLAAIVAAGAAGLMAGRAERYRLAARDARRRAEELREELSNTQESLPLMNRLVHEREDDLSWVERQVRLSLADGRKAIGEYSVFLKREGTSSHLPLLFSEALRDWARDLDGLETVINNISRELVGEQTQLVDILPPEEVDKFYGVEENKEVNDTAAEE